MKQFFTTMLVFILFLQLSTMEHVPLVAPASEAGNVLSILSPELIQAQNKRSALISADLALSTTKESGEFDSVVFTGDIMLGRNVEYLSLRHGFDYPFARIQLKDIARNPAVVGNFESSMSRNHTMTPPLKLKFSTNPQSIEPLADAGFTHLSLANNHSFDFKDDGFLNTVAHLEEAKLSVFGCSVVQACDSVRYIEVNGGTVALIGAEALSGTNAAVKAALKRAAKVSDVQIIYIHWGEEYKPGHNTEQKRLADYLVEAGADLIIGHHPHVVQDVELIENVPVFYSLGNFIFDQYFSAEVQEGLVIALKFDPTPVLQLLPVSSKDALSQPTFLSGDDKAEFLYELSKRSDSNLREFIARGEIPFSQQFASSPKTAMINQ